VSRIAGVTIPADFHNVTVPLRGGGATRIVFFGAPETDRLRAPIDRVNACRRHAGFLVERAADARLLIGWRGDTSLDGEGG